MKLMIQFPTRGRYERFFEYLHEYIRMAKTNPLIHVSMDNNDMLMNNDIVRRQLEELKCYWSYKDNEGKHAAVNSNIDKYIDECNILLLASDDMRPIVDGYDEIIIEDMKKYYPDTDGALWYFDGNRKDMNTLQIMGKKYYKRFEYIYRQEYKAFCGDVEFQAVAESLNKLTYIDKCIIKHEHHSVSKEKWGKDHTYNVNDRWAVHDDNLFLKRKAQNFPLERDW